MAEPRVLAAPGVVERARVGERLIVLTAGVGLFLSTLDTGIVNIALPTLQSDLATDVTTIAWTVTLYLMVLSGANVACGRLGDRYGRLRLYSGGLVVFTAGSALCGLAPSALVLLVARAVQAIGAAMVQATAAALVTTLLPAERRGVAMGTLGLLMGLGPVLGPTVGGVLLSTAGWRWLFWINLPFCLAGLWGCRRLAGSLPDAVARAEVDLDAPGIALFAVAGLAGLVGTALWPGVAAGDPRPLGALALGFAAGGLFLRHEARATQPILAPSLLRRPAFAAPLLGIFAFGASAAMLFILPPYFLEGVAGLAPWQVGLTAFAGPLGMVFTARWAGGLAGRIGTRPPMLAGLLLMLLADLGLSCVGAGTPPAAIAAGLLLWGVGGGLCQSPNMLALMAAFPPERQATIGAIQRLVVNLANAVGAAVAAACLAAASAGPAGLAGAFEASWRVGALTLFVALAAFAWHRD